MNTALIRQLNVARIFHVLRTVPGSSQRELAAATGLDRATVSTVVAQLDAASLVRRAPRPRHGRAGRPEEALSLSEEAGLFVGVSIEPRLVHLVATTIAARPVAERRIASGGTVEESVRHVEEGINSLSEEVGSPAGQVRGVGVGLPGLMGHGGRLVFGPNLGWRDVDLRALLERDLPYPVSIDNDTKAAALAETLFGASREVSDFLLVVSHSGVGGAVYLGGKLQRGWHGYSGEFGHVKVEPGGRACRCGGRGCLETYVSEPAMLARLAEAGATCASLEEAAERAAAGDTVVVEVLALTGELLGRALANQVNMLDLREVVLGGRLAVVADAILPATRAALERDVLPATLAGFALEVSPLGTAAVPMGGVALAMEGFLSSPTWPAQADRAEDRERAVGRTSGR